MTAAVNGVKVCSRCNVALELTKFGRNKAQPDGYQNQCKQCRSDTVVQYRATRQEWIARNSQRLRDQGRGKYRKYAQNEKRRASLHYHADPVAANRKRLERDKAKPALRTARHHKHEAKVLGLDGSFTGQEWESLCEDYGHKCASCGESKPLTVDHIIPRSKGGSNFISNIQPLCRSCNARKSDSVPDVPQESC